MSKDKAEEFKEKLKALMEEYGASFNIYSKGELYSYAPTVDLWIDGHKDCSFTMFITPDDL